MDFGLHFSTAIHRDGYLYGFEGRNEPDASLACVDAATGKMVWRESRNGRTLGSGSGGRREVVGTYVVRCWRPTDSSSASASWATCYGWT